MKTFNPKKDLFSIMKISKEFVVEDKSPEIIKVKICDKITEELIQYLEEFVNHVRKNAYAMSEEKYVGYNYACDEIIQQLNTSYIDLNDSE